MSMSHDLHVWWKFVHVPTGVFFNVVMCVDGELSVRVHGHNHWSNVGLEKGVGGRERGEEGGEEWDGRRRSRRGKRGEVEEGEREREERRALVKEFKIHSFAIATPPNSRIFLHCHILSSDYPTDFPL